MIWLKRVDSLAHLLPGRLIRSLLARPESRGVCLLRPGGLGDLVVLTRAFLELGIDPREVDWVVESRNAPWLDYLGIPYLLYHQLRGVLSVLLRGVRYEKVLNTEQYHGLASIFACGLVGTTGRIFGFSGNPRADLLDLQVAYDSQRNHELQAFKELLKVSALPSTFAPAALRASILPPNPVKKDGSYGILALGGLQDPTRRLSLNVWRRLLELSLAKHETTFLLGSPTDRYFSEQLFNCSGSSSAGLINLVGAKAFGEVVDIISGARAFYGVDSGLLHVADFFLIPSTVVFTPRKLVQWRPQTPGSVILDDNLESFDLRSSTKA